MVKTTQTHSLSRTRHFHLAGVRRTGPNARKRRGNRRFIDRTTRLGVKDDGKMLQGNAGFYGTLAADLSLRNPPCGKKQNRSCFPVPNEAAFHSEVQDERAIREKLAEFEPPSFTDAKRQANA